VTTSADFPPYVEVDLDTFATLLSTGIAVVDVREPDEHAAYRVQGVISIPMNSVPDRIAEVPSADTVYVICARGGRSAQVTQFLRAQGIDAVNVAGGTDGWVESGRTVEQG
jgi:rhodanese-related sulfurtransferase